MFEIKFDGDRTVIHALLPDNEIVVDGDIVPREEQEGEGVGGAAGGQAARDREDGSEYLPSGEESE